MADKHNISIDVGTTYKMTVIWKDDAGDPIDLTGYVARMQIRPAFGSTLKLVDLTSVSGITITALQGKLEIVIPDTVTEDIVQSSGVYDIEVESGTGETTRILQGEVTFNPEVTRV